MSHNFIIKCLGVLKYVVANKWLNETTEAALNVITPSHRLFVKGTRAMLTSGLAYKNYVISTPQFWLTNLVSGWN